MAKVRHLQNCGTGWAKGSVSEIKSGSLGGQASSDLESGVQRQLCREPGHETEDRGEEIQSSNQQKQKGRVSEG